MCTLGGWDLGCLDNCTFKTLKNKVRKKKSTTRFYTNQLSDRFTMETWDSLGLLLNLIIILSSVLRIILFIKLASKFLQQWTITYLGFFPDRQKLVLLSACLTACLTAVYWPPGPVISDVTQFTDIVCYYDWQKWKAEPKKEDQNWNKLSFPVISGGVTGSVLYS